MRRVLPRQPTYWRGTYSVEGDPKERRRECRVIDISSIGAGLELLNTSADEVHERTLDLTIHLRAEVRNIRPAKGDHLRVGTQFVGLAEGDHAYLESLTRIDARW